MAGDGNDFLIPGTIMPPDTNKIRAALADAQGINIQNIATHDSLANRLKLSYSAVENNPYQAKVAAKAQEIENRKDQMFLTWSQYDAPNAALARDDEKLADLLDVKPLGEALDRGRYIVQSADLARRALNGDKAARDKLMELKGQYKGLEKDRDLARQEKLYYTGETGRPFYSFLEDAAEQLPILARTTLPAIKQGVQTGLTAASIAAIAGQIGPQGGLPEEIITVPWAGGIGFTSGFLSGVAKESYELESGSLMADLLGEVDANGNPLSDDMIKTAGEIYGTAAALVETVSEGLFLKILGKVGLGSLTKEGFKAFYKSAVLRAAKAGTTGDVLLSALGGALANAGIEGTEEGTQEALQILTEFAFKSFAPGYFPENDLFTKENVQRIGQSAAVGFEVGLFFGMGPTVAAATINVARARQAQAFTHNQVKLHESIEQTKTKQASPERMVTFLEQVKGITSDVYLPADAVQELYQSGTDLISPLGFTLEEVQELATNGQDMVVPLSETQAFLNMEEFEAASKIMRAGPDAYNYAEVANQKDFEEGQELLLMEAYDEHIKEMTAWENEASRLRDEFILAINANKNLTAQAVAFAGSVEKYVDSIMDLYTGFANRMSMYGRSPSNLLEKISAKALLNNGQLNPAGMNYEELTAYEAAQEEHPIKTQIKGRLSAASLKEKWPGAYKAIMDAGNGWVFNRKSDGVAVDELADELVRSGPMAADQTFYADDLVEWLKEPRRQGPPVAAQALYQADNQVTAEENYARGLEAMDRVIAEQTDILDAMSRPEVGGISFYWGTPGEGKKLKGGAGISHLIARQNSEGLDGEAIAREMPAVIAYGQVGEPYGPPGGERRNIKHNGNTAVLSLYRFGNQETWLVTGWVDDSADAPGSVNVADATHTNPSGIRDKVGAAETVNKNITPLGADGKPLFQGQGKAPRGQVKIYPDGYLIGLFPRANLSTLLHETGHIFYEEFEAAVNAAEGSDIQLASDFDKLREWLGVEETQQDLTVEQKEKFARGFEAYLREGVAPSEELSSAFARFKKWLTHIYKQATQLGVELTDEVRGVFDRMLTYDFQVEEAASMNGLFDLTEKDLDNLDKLSESDRNYALQMISLAKEYASESLQQKANKNLRTRIREYKAHAEVAVTNNPFYLDTVSIVEAGGIDMDSAKYNFDEATIKAVNLKHGNVFTKNGADLEVVAAEYGYSSGKGLVKLFLQMPSRQDAIQQMVDADIRKYDAQFSAIEELIKQEGVKDQLNIIAQYFSEMLGKKAVDTRAYALVAAQAMASTSMRRAVRGDLYLSSFKRAWGQMRGILASGKIATSLKDGKMKAANAAMVKTLEANYQAQINYESYAQSLEINKAKTSLQNRVKKFVHQKSANPDARYTVMNLAMNYGLGKYVRDIGEGRDASTVKAWLDQAQENGYELLLDENLMVGQKAWQDLSVAEFQELENNIVQIMTVERNERKFLQAKQKEDLYTVCENISKVVSENKDPLPRKTVERENAVARVVGSVHGAHTKIETLCIRMDGGTPGIVHESIYQPMADARDAENRRFKQVRAELNAKNLFGMYSKRELSRLGSQKYFIESIGESVTKENMIAVALNMGNEGNYQRIKDGHGWSDAQINDIVKGLDERDWAFVQNVWDYLETFKKEAFDLEQRVTGIRPKGVQAQAFVNPLGQAMRGGYYPIEYNVTKSAVAYDKQQKKIEQEVFGTNGGTQAMTAKGHLKARASQGLGTPLDLTLPVITNHVFNVVHDLAFREAVLDVAKIIRNNKFRESVEGTYGPGIYRLFMPWLKDVANERQEPMMCINKWAAWARSGSTLMAMGYKLTTMIVQPLGFAQSMAYLGYKYSGAGMKTVFGQMHNLPQLWEQTKEMSEFMANRIDSYDREIRDMSKKLKPNASYFEVVDTFRKYAFHPMGYFQLAVDLPTWWGAYYKGLDQYGGDDVKAIAFADSAVRLTQSGGNVEDLAAVQRGGEIQRLFTMFYSYFSALYNLSTLQFSQIDTSNKPEAMLRAANLALLLFFFPAVVSELVAGRGPDDDEENWEWLAQNLLVYPFQTVVGVRDLANGIFSEFDYQITPASGAPASIVKWVKNVYAAITEGKTDRLLKSSVEALGFAAHLPIKQAVISVGNVWEYINGEDPDFYIRDLLFAKPQSRR